MKDYLKLHASQAAYETWLASPDFITPNVSTITGSSSVLYKPKINTPSGYNFLDILWSDGTATQTVRPTTDGVTPIGLCVAPTGFFGDSEKARFMALKYAGGTKYGETIGNATGSTTYENQLLKWEYNSTTNIIGLTNYNQIVSDNQKSFAWLADYEGNTMDSNNSGESIMLYTENNTWMGLETNNTFTGYALGDINGKQNTTTVANLGLLSNYPAFASVLNYYTPGTQAGDWYLPTLGELAIICANQSRINPVLNNISSLYGTDCMSVIYNYNDSLYWSSTEYDSFSAFFVSFSVGLARNINKSNEYYVIPMLQK